MLDCLFKEFLHRSFFSKETVTFPKILHNTLSGTVVCHFFFFFYHKWDTLTISVTNKQALKSFSFADKTLLARCYPFPAVLPTLGIRIYPPTEILLVIFPAKISLYGSTCIREAKSCIQPGVTFRWGGMVELQQDQPALGKNSVPELWTQPLELQPCCAQQGPVRNG